MVSRGYRLLLVVQRQELEQGGLDELPGAHLTAHLVPVTQC